MKKINKNVKKQKNINSNGVRTDKKVVSKKPSGATIKTAHKRTGEVDFSKKPTNLKNSTYIHFSRNEGLYKSNDFDSINRTGIEIRQSRDGKQEYIANNLVKFKSYKTLNGAQSFMVKQGYKPIAVEDGKNIIYLSSKAEKRNKR